MSKKTFYTLGRIALAAALTSAWTHASAANCSAQYCFVDGTLKWTTSQDIELLEDVLTFPISTSTGSTTTVINGAVGVDGYVSHIISSPITNVRFSNQRRISIASTDGSNVIFGRIQSAISGPPANMQNMTIKLQSAPLIVSINSILQGVEQPTLWNLSGDGTFSLEEVFSPEIGIVGDGTISLTTESDGYYHARVTVPAMGLIGGWNSRTKTATGALEAFTKGIGVRGVWIGTFYSVPFGSIKVDMRFTAATQ